MVTPPREFLILEHSSGRYSGLLVGEDGVTGIPAATLLTLTLTLYVVQTNGTIAYVNGRNDQNVLNANNVTVDVNGNLVWSIQTLDTGLQQALPEERHIALFQFTAPNGVVGKHEMILIVKALLEVP